MQNPFDFTFAIKFVDGDPSNNVFGVGNGVQTGDMTFAIIAAILALVAVGAGLLWFVRNRQVVMATARTTLGAHVTMRGVSKPKGQFALLAFAIVALALSLITFVGSGTAQAIAEGGQIGVPVVKAQVFDDGTVNINPISVKNNKGYDIKVRSSQWALDGEAWTDAGLQNSQLSDTALDGVVYEGVPADENIQYFVYNNEEAGGPFDRIEVGETATFDLGISGLSAETANSYLDQVVYIHQITFENAEVDVRDAIDFTEFNLGETPFHEGEEFYLTYDGKWHNPLNYDLEADLETEGHTYPYYPNVESEDDFYNMYGQDVQLDADGDEEPYMTPIALKPGFVFKGSHGATEVEIPWYIDPAPYYVKSYDVTKDYDMYPIFYDTRGLENENADIFGLQTREIYDENFNLTEKEEVAPLVYDSEELGWINHVYQTVEGRGAINGCKPVFGHRGSETEFTTAALEDNYYRDRGSCEYGQLTINPIDYIAVPIVPWDKQEYTYNATEQGDSLIWNCGTLETIYEEPEFLTPWEQDIQDFWLDPSLLPEDPLVEGYKTIENVSESGPVTYFIENTLVLGSGEDVEYHVGDYNEMTGSYDLIMNPRQLKYWDTWEEQIDPDTKITLAEGLWEVDLTGFDTSDAALDDDTVVNDIYYHEDGDNNALILPEIDDEGYFQYVIDQPAGHPGRIINLNINDFTFTGAANGFGTHEALLTANDNTNFIGAVGIPFSIVQPTEVAFDDWFFGGDWDYFSEYEPIFYLYRNGYPDGYNNQRIDNFFDERDWDYDYDYDLWPLCCAKNRYNPIYGNQDYITLVINPNMAELMPDIWSLVNNLGFYVNVEATFPGAYYDYKTYENLVLGDDYSYYGFYQIPIPFENGVYADRVVVTISPAANLLQFNDMTEPAPEEDGMGTENYPLSHVEALSGGEWVPYESVAPIYTVGTTITKVAGYDNMFFVHSDSYGEDQYLRVELGAYNPEDDEEIAAYNKYVKEHYSIDADTFLPSYTVGDEKVGLTIEYELTQADRYTVNKLEDERWRADSITIPYVLDPSAQYLITPAVSDVYPGTEVTVTAKQVAEGENVFIPWFGWSLTLLDEDGEIVDVVYAGGEDPVATFTMPDCDVTYVIEPFARLDFAESELTPGTINRVDYQTQNMAHPARYAFGIPRVGDIAFVPREQLLGSKDGKVLDTFLPYSVWYTNSGLMKVEHDLAVNFTVETKPGYDFIGFDESYVVDFDDYDYFGQVYSIVLGGQKTEYFTFNDATNNTTAWEELGIIGPYDPEDPETLPGFSHIEMQVNGDDPYGWEYVEDNKIEAPQFSYLKKVADDTLEATVDGNVIRYRIVPGVYDDESDPTIAAYNEYVKEHYFVGPDTLDHEIYDVTSHTSLSYALEMKTRYNLSVAEDNVFWSVPAENAVTIPEPLSDTATCEVNFDSGNDSVYAGAEVTVNVVPGEEGDNVWQPNCGWTLVAYAGDAPVASVVSWERKATITIPDSELLDGVENLSLAIEPFMVLRFHPTNVPIMEGLQSLIMTMDGDEETPYPYGGYKLFIPRGTVLTSFGEPLNIFSAYASIYSDNGTPTGNVQQIRPTDENAVHRFKYVPTAKEYYEIEGWDFFLGTIAVYGEHETTHQKFDVGLNISSAGKSITWDTNPATQTISSVKVDGGDIVTGGTVSAAPGQTITFTKAEGIDPNFSLMLKKTYPELFASPSTNYLYYDDRCTEYSFVMPDDNEYQSLEIAAYNNVAVEFDNQTEWLAGYGHNEPEYWLDYGDAAPIQVETGLTWVPLAATATVDDNVVTYTWTTQFDGSTVNYEYSIVNKDGTYKLSRIDDVVAGDPISFAFEPKAAERDIHQLSVNVAEPQYNHIASIKDSNGYEYAVNQEEHSWNAVAVGTWLTIEFDSETPVAGSTPILYGWDVDNFPQNVLTKEIDTSTSPWTVTFQMKDCNVLLSTGGIDDDPTADAADNGGSFELYRNEFTFDQGYNNEGVTQESETDFVLSDILFALDLFHLFF